MDPVTHDAAASHPPASQAAASHPSARQEFAAAPKHDAAHAYHGTLGSDVFYIAAVDDAQSGVDSGQPLTGKIVKVVKEDDENHILICNLTLFAHDSASLIFKANVELGTGRGKFQFA